MTRIAIQMWYHVFCCDLYIRIFWMLQVAGITSENLVQRARHHLTMAEALGHDE